MDRMIYGGPDLGSLLTIWPCDTMLHPYTGTLPFIPVRSPVPHEGLNLYGGNQAHFQGLYKHTADSHISRYPTPDVALFDAVFSDQTVPIHVRNCPDPINMTTAFSCFVDSSTEKQRRETAVYTVDFRPASTSKVRSQPNLDRLVRPNIHFRVLFRRVLSEVGKSFIHSQNPSWIFAARTGHAQ